MVAVRIVRVEGNWVLSMIVRIFTFLGFLHGSDDIGQYRRKRPSIRCIVSLAVVNIYFLHTILCAIEYIFRTREIFTTLLYRISIILRYGSVTYFVNHSVFSSSSILNCFEMLSEAESHHRPLYKKRVNGVIRLEGRVSPILNLFLVSIFLLYFLMLVLSVPCLLYEMDMEHYYDVYFYNIKFGKGYEAFAYAVAISEVACYVILLMLEFLSQAMAGSMAGAMTTQLNLLIDKIRLQDTKPRWIVTRHTTLYSAIMNFNRLFRNSIAFWLVQWMAIFSLSLPILVMGIDLGATLETIYWALDTVVPLISVAFLLVCLSMICDCNSRLIASCQFRSLRLMDISLEKQLQGTFLLMKFGSSRMSFCILDCVEIDKNFVVNFIGGTFTYFTFIVTLLMQKTAESDVASTH